MIGYNVADQKYCFQLENEPTQACVCRSRYETRRRTNKVHTSMSKLIHWHTRSAANNLPTTTSLQLVTLNFRPYSCLLSLLILIVLSTLPMAFLATSMAWRWMNGLFHDIHMEGDGAAIYPFWEWSQGLISPTLRITGIGWGASAPPAKRHCHHPHQCWQGTNKPTRWARANG